MAILKVIQDFGNWFWGIPILILIGGGGLFLTIYLGFPQLRHFGYAMSQTFGKVFAKKEEGNSGHREVENKCVRRLIRPAFSWHSPARPGHPLR